MDFAKAFDKVPHQRLCRKLKSHGISGKLLSWISEWLVGRTQRVCISGAMSRWLFVLSGVLQGSVLGPILFLIYINDLDCGLINSILEFTDDTKIYGTVSTPNKQTVLQDDLDKLWSWSNEWQMLFNVEKCKVMHFGKGNNLQKYHLNNIPLTEVTQETDLGITVTNDLKSSQQCLQAYNKANKVLGVINRSIMHKKKDILVKLYKSLVRPQLEYCTASWSPHYSKDKDLLERIQHRFTRMVPGLKNLPYEEQLS